MRPGDRVEVTQAYGDRWPHHAHYVGEQGTVVENRGPADWSRFVRAKLDCDDGPGMFCADELVRIAHQ